MKKLLATIFALIFFIMPCLNACGRAEELPYVVISRANVLLSVGDEYTLNARVYPEKYSDLEIEWTTSNSSIVTCEGGKIEAVGPGSAVIMASVNGGNAFTTTVNVSEEVRNHANLIVGESFTVPESAYKNIYDGPITWESSDPEKVSVVDGVVTGNDICDAVIYVCSGDDIVSVYSVSVFENVQAMVDFRAPELPITMSYMSGSTEVEIQDFVYTVVNDGKGLLVSFTISYKKTADISGSHSKNPTGFYAELYSDEVGYCTTYRVESDLLFVEQPATFQSNFYADVTKGLRHFEIRLFPIEK